MPKRPSLDPILDKTRNRWRVDIPPSLSKSGKRGRSYFKTRKEARTYLDKLEGNTPSASISPTLAMEADKAHSLLADLKVDLVQVAREYVEARTLLADTGGTIVEAARAYRENWTERNASCLFGTAVATYLESRTDLRDTTLKSYKYTLDQTFKPLHDKTLADLTTFDLEAVLENKGATAAQMHRRNLGVFWRWASKPPRNWAKLEVMQAVETQRVSSDADIRILNPADVKALLAAAEVESPAAASAYALAVFGGVRMAELERLTWANVLQDHIEIGKEVAKKHSRRLVPICPSLRSWLDTYRNGEEDDSSIVPTNWSDVSKTVRRRAGWAVVARLLKNPPKPTRGPWPTNACRHTCASVQVAIGTPLEDLTFKFGHSGGHEILRAHYVARLTKQDALAILSTGPHGTVIQAATEAPPPAKKKAAKKAKKAQQAQ